MKKIVLLLVLLGVTSLAAQDMGSLKSAATEATSSDSMIEQLADNQIKSLTQKFNLSEAQATQVSSLVKQVMKSPKFTKMLGKYSPDKLLSGNGTDMLQGALLGNNSFMKGMEDIVSTDQLDLMKKAKQKLN